MSRSSFRNSVRNERGIALVVVLMVIVVISVLGLSLLALSSTNIKQSTIERDYQATYYIAEAGVTYLLNEITPLVTEVTANSEEEFFNKITQQFDSKLPDNYEDFELTFGEKPIAKLKINTLSPEESNRSCKNNENTSSKGYKIISEGNIGNRTRTVEKPFCINWNYSSNEDLPFTLLKDMAVFSNNSINFNSSIDGNIGTNAIKPGSIYIDWSANLNGEIFKVTNADENVVQKVSEWKSFDKSIINLPQAVDYKDKLSFPSFPTALPTFNNLLVEGGPKNDKTISKNGDYQKITIINDRTLTIDVGSQDRIIKVKDLILEQGHIKIIGTGKLIMYIENKFEINSGSTINFSDISTVDNLNLFYKGTYPLNPGGSTRIVGSLYIKSANISLGGSGQIIGNIITEGKEVMISGAGTASNGLVFAPNANVQLVNSGSVIGTVISDFFSINGGSKVTYKEIEENTLTPFFPQVVGESDISIGPTKETK